MKRLTKLLILLSAAAGLISPATAAQADGSTRRAAILVGVKSYRPDPFDPAKSPKIQQLRNLNTPCQDVDEISGKLQLAGWTQDNSDPDAEIHTYCDAEMEKVRDDIERRVYEFDKPGDLLIILLAGHGAEVAGQNYFFGPNAKLDMHLAVDRLATWSRNPLFVGQSLNLDTSILSTAGILYHGNILVILGACRDDPVTYSEIAKALKTPLGPPQYGTRPQGVRVLYATTPGKTIADGVELSNLGRAFSAHISSSTRIYTAIKDADHDVILATADGSLENPVPIGDLNDIDLCFSSCDAVRGSPNRVRHFSSSALNLFTSVAYRISEPPAASRERLDAFSSKAPFAIPPGGFKILRADESFGATDYGDVHTSRVDVDLYWCESGGSGNHEQIAAKVGGQLSRPDPEANRVVASSAHVVIGRVRSKELPDADNFKPGLRFARNAVRFYQTDAAAGRIARLVARQIGGRVFVEPQPGSGPSVVTAFVCSGGRKLPTSPRLFLQASKEEQRTAALFVSGQIERRNPALWVADAVDISKKVQASSPDHTTIKFFDEADADLASGVGKTVDELLPAPATIKRASVRPGVRPPRGLVELWLGRDLDPSRVFGASAALH